MNGIERISKLTPGQEWKAVHRVTDHDNGVTITTEALELPHGCLVRSTAVQNAMLGNKIAHTMTFVAGLKMERVVPESFQFTYKP